MGRLITTLLMLATFQTGYGQEDKSKISGTIVSNSGPVPGATIQVLNSENGVVADTEGHFLLEKVPAGDVTFEVRSIGFKPVTRQVHLKKGEHRTLSIMLVENSLGLDEVVVTGTMKPTFVKASPVKVSVVTAQYLNTFTPAAATSVVEGIKLISGIQEVVACGVCFTNSISINGLPGPYTAVLMDGTPIYGNLASVYGLNGIPGMIIDRFEVIKGPSSTLYGSEAVAGVINIITKDPEKQPALSIDVMGTSHLESFGNISAAPRIGASHGYVGFNYAYINDFDDRNHDNFGDMANLDRYSFFTKWNIHRKSKKAFSIAGKYYYEDRRNGVEKFLKDRNYQRLRGSDSIYGESIYTHRLELFGTYELAGSEPFKIDFSGSQHLQDSYYGADYYQAEQSIGFANLIWDKIFNDHSILAGLTTRYQHYDDNTVATEKGTSSGMENRPDNQFIPGIFLQDEWKASNKFTLLAGGRADHYSTHGLIFSPRINIKYMAGQWSTIRANFGTGFRIVNLFAEDHAFITGQRTVEILEDLKPERSINGTLNFNHIYTIGKSQGTFDADAYYTYFFNKIIPDYQDPSKIVYENTDGYAVTKGLGINLTHEFPFPLALNVGVNIQKVTQTERLQNGSYITKSIEFASKWSGVCTANYTWSKAKVSVAYTLRLTGPMPLPEVFDLDANGNPLEKSRPTLSEPFMFHNIQLSMETSPSFSFYAGIQNIFDYVQSLPPITGYNDPNAPTGFSEYFDTSYAFAPIHGREFYLGVKWTLDRK